MHPEAAAERQLKAGALVRVFNERGACLAGLSLDVNQRKDTVTLPTGRGLSLVRRAEWSRMETPMY